MTQLHELMLKLPVMHARQVQVKSGVHLKSKLEVVHLKKKLHQFWLGAGFGQHAARFGCALD